MSISAPTFWQKIDHIIGPAKSEDFSRIGQIPIREALETFIISKSNEQTRLLDAGCNTGVEGYRLFEKEYPGLYYGVDSNYKALQHAQENLKGRQAIFCQADCSQINFPDRHFDIVMTKDVIEHAPYYKDILAELARLTNRWLLLSMFIRMHDAPDYIHLEPAGFYHNRYQRSKLYEIVTNLGFKTPQVLFQLNEDELLGFERS